MRDSKKMHETAIARDIIRIVSAEAKEHDVGRIRRVRIKAGELRAIQRDSLSFAFEYYSQGTVCEGAKLEVENIPTRARCRDCGLVSIVSYNSFACPQCSCIDLDVVEGMELTVHEIEGD